MSNVAGLPGPDELKLAPPVAERVPLGDMTIVPAMALAEISPKDRPFRVVMPRELITLAVTVAVATAACEGAYTQVAHQKSSVLKQALLRIDLVSNIFLIINKIDDFFCKICDLALIVMRGKV